MLPGMRDILMNSVQAAKSVADKATVERATKHVDTTNCIGRIQDSGESDSGIGLTTDVCDQCCDAKRVCLVPMKEDLTLG